MINLLIYGSRCVSVCVDVYVHINFFVCRYILGGPGGGSSKEHAGGKRHRFNPWSGRGQPTPVFLPRESYGQGGLVGYSP